MNFRGIEICCPSCRGDLRELVSAFQCQACARSYPVDGGIPDLRVFPDPYIKPDADRYKGLALAAKFGEMNFEGLIDYYYSITAAVPAHHARQYKRGLMAGLARAQAAVAGWPAGEALLDVGCGTAPLLVAAAPKFKTLVGVDISFRWLTVGRKRLLEAGLDVPLICACAEALPFPGPAFDRVAGESVVETLEDQSRAMRECCRVLRPGGRIFLSTPNRFSLGPDPHIGVWMGGWLPESWIAEMARRQGAVPPKRRLLSPRSLGKLLRRAGFHAVRTTLPDIPEAQRAQFGSATRRLIDLYRTLRALPVTSTALRWIGPLLHCEAEKGY
ncbi:MAG: methyltransferase domain-containing protein [Candidatus Solibacter usitatus]|nr:methyltransferase domain-containing protein [Candidatus Solibacter usitatus]